MVEGISTPQIIDEVDVNEYNTVDYKSIPELLEPYQGALLAKIGTSFEEILKKYELRLVPVYERGRKIMSDFRRIKKFNFLISVAKKEPLFGSFRISILNYFYINA